MKEGNGTVKYRELDLEIEFGYSDYSPEVRTLSNGDPGYPSEGGDFEIYAIKHKGEDIMEILSESTISEIENMYINQMEYA